jgi:hypothetical protein
MPLLAAAFAAAYAAYAVVTVAMTVALSAVASAFSAKRKQGPATRDVTAKGTVEPRQLIYGQARSGGVIIYYELGGPNGLYLFYVIALAGHQCDSITDVWLDSRVIKNAEINASTGVVASTASNGTFWNGGNPELWIFKHLGTSAQAADTTLETYCPAWDSSHRGAGIAYIVVQMQHNDPAYPAGAPSSVYALISGRRLYDPRQDSTNGGSGSQRYTDATTWTWSDNWALAVRDYLSGGSIYYDVATPNPLLTIAESNARINDAYTITAANHADEVITVPAPLLSGTTAWINGESQVTGTSTQFSYQLAVGNYLLGPDGNWYEIASITSDTVLNLTVSFPGMSTSFGQTTQWNTSASATATQARFTCDTQLSCGDTHATNISNMLTGANGHLAYCNGKYRIYAGCYDTPTVTLGADDLVGSVEVATHTAGKDLYNLVSGTFYDELKAWQQSTFPAQQSAAYQTTDGGVFKRDVDLPATRTSWRAQRLANVLLAQSRNMMTITLSGVGPAGMNIGEWETFMLTIPEYNWTSLIFRCLSWKFLTSGLVSITGMVETSAAYADLALGNYQILAGNSAPVMSQKLPAAPGGLVTLSFPTEIILTVALSEPLPRGAVVQVWESTSSSPFSSATLIAEGASTLFTIPNRNTTQYYYWVTVLDITGNQSLPYPSSVGQPGAANGTATADMQANSVSSIGSNFSAGVVSCGASVSIHTPTQFTVISITVTTVGDPVEIDISCNASFGNIPNGVFAESLFSVWRDGASIGSTTYDATQLPSSGINTTGVPITLVATDSPSAGSHTYELHYTVEASGSTGSVTALLTNNFIKVREIKK